MSGLLQLSPPPTLRQLANPKKYFAPNDCARDHAVIRVQPAIQLSILAAALIKSLIAFVSSR